MFDDFDDDDFDETDDSDDASAPAGLAAPRLASAVVGHDEIERQLLAAFNDNRLPHALIFSGPVGIGKATFAYRFARFLLAHVDAVDSGPSLFGDVLPVALPNSFSIATDHRVFQQVASGGHPDLLVVERLMDEKKGKLQDVVAVDEVRKITPFLRLTASDGGWRVVIVDDADTMNRASQNAILKILEEPPPRTVLILIAHRPGALLPTIRSRSRLMNFLPPEPADFAELLKRTSPALGSNDIELLRAIAGGSVGSALGLEREGAITATAQLTALLDNWPNFPWEDIHKLSERLGSHGQDSAYAAFVETFLWLLRSFIRSAATATALPSVIVHSAIKLRTKIDPAALLGASDALAAHFAAADFGNLDRRQAVLGAFTLLGNLAKL